MISNRDAPDSESGRIWPDYPAHFEIRPDLPDFSFEGLRSSFRVENSLKKFNNLFIFRIYHPEHLFLRLGILTLALVGGGGGMNSEHPLQVFPTV